VTLTTKDKYTRARVTHFFKLILIAPFYLIDLEISHSFFELFAVWFVPKEMVTLNRWISISHQPLILAKNNNF